MQMGVWWESGFSIGCVPEICWIKRAIFADANRFVLDIHTVAEAVPHLGQPPPVAKIGAEHVHRAICGARFPSTLVELALAAEVFVSDEVAIDGRAIGDCA